MPGLLSNELPKEFYILIVTYLPAFCKKISPIGKHLHEIIFLMHKSKKYPMQVELFSPTIHKAGKSYKTPSPLVKLLAKEAVLVSSGGYKVLYPYQSLPYYLSTLRDIYQMDSFRDITSWLIIVPVVKSILINTFSSEESFRQ